MAQLRNENIRMSVDGPIIAPDQSEAPIFVAIDRL